MPINKAILKKLPKKKDREILKRCDADTLSFAVACHKNGLIDEYRSQLLAEKGEDWIHNTEMHMELKKSGKWVNIDLTGLTWIEDFPCEDMDHDWNQTACKKD